MKKRLIAICLIGVLLAFPACKSNSGEELNSVGGAGGVANGQNSGSNGGASDANGGSVGGGSGDQNQNQNVQNPSGESTGSNSQSGGNGGSSGPSSLGETFGAGQPVAMKKGETIWFGPCSAEQAAQFTFNAGETSSGGGAIKVEDIGGGFAIYSFKAPSDGKAIPAVGDKYKDVFLMTKSAMNVAAYFGHWDNQKARNLYDLRFDKSGKWIDASGKLQNSKAGQATHAIPVSKGETLTFGPVRAGQPVLGYAYDSAGKPLAMINGYGLKTAFTFPQGMVTYTYTVPEGAASVRLNVADGQSDQFMAMKTPFTAEQYQRLTGVKPADVEDPLEGKSCLFLGDSICAAGSDGRRGWAGRVADATGAICINAGVSGAALSNCRLNRPGATKNHQIYKQLEDYSKSDFDYVLIHGGVNDAWDSKAIGSVTRGYDPAGFDLSTYAGGLEMTIYTAIELYGDTAAIGYLMNFQLPKCSYGVVAQSMGEFFAVGKEICEKWGISYFDMYNNKQLNNQLEVNNTRYLPDGVHPNTGGYDVLGPFITNYMKTMTPPTQAILEELASQ